MAWRYDVAQQRIEQLINSCPTIVTESLEARYQPMLIEARMKDFAAAPQVREALMDIPRNKALLVDAVHVYARLVNYDEYRLEDGSETERSHKKALNFLHLHYAATDRLLEEFGAQRVDFHGGRLHCVVVDPIDNEPARVVKALMLARRLEEFAAVANRDIAEGHYTARFKIGLDTGICVAINSGSGCEQEPLFLGSAANYAAKLADGDGHGIFPSNRVRQILNLATFPGIEEERSFPLSQGTFNEIYTQANAGGYYLAGDLQDERKQYERLVEGWRGDIQSHKDATGGQSAFQFHTHIPPLKTIDYSNLSPGNSVRMPLASIFADLDGYTAYIDQCRITGDVSGAVRALHVLRGEFHNVLKNDFSSRKVRYIGDCMHGILAFGTADNINLAETTREAVKCAAALQASFELIQERLGGLDELGLAIGIEVGETPVSRIGIRGPRSVRVASSGATIQSQLEQESIIGSGLALGPNAYEQLSLTARRYFPNRRLENPDYDTLALMLTGVAAVPKSSEAHASVARPEFRPHCAR